MGEGGKGKERWQDRTIAIVRHVPVVAAGHSDLEVRPLVVVVVRFDHIRDHVGLAARQDRAARDAFSAGHSKNSYRGQVKINPSAKNARNYSQCDSLLIGDKSNSNTFPYIQAQNSTAKIEHEASTSKIGEEQIFYFLQRGIDPENAISLIISGFCSEVFKKLPMEFAAEADKLLSLKLEGSIG